METWLTVQADGRHTAAAVRELYSRPARSGALHTVKLLGGTALYLVRVALLLATLATARRHSPGAKCIPAAGVTGAAESMTATRTLGRRAAWQVRTLVGKYRTGVSS
jgi:hypothetical protein